MSLLARDNALVLSAMYSGEYSNELHAAGIPSLLTSLATELAASNIDSVQVRQFIPIICHLA